MSQSAKIVQHLFFVCSTKMCDTHEQHNSYANMENVLKKTVHYTKKACDMKVAKIAQKLRVFVQSAAQIIFSPSGRHSTHSFVDDHFTLFL